MSANTSWYAYVESSPKSRLRRLSPTPNTRNDTLISHFSQISGSEPLYLGAEGTNASSPQTHSLPLWVQTKRLKRLQKNFSKSLKNRQKSTRRLGETMRLAELLKSGRTFISFWCFFPHRHLLFSSHTPRNATWSFVVSGWLVSGSVTSCAGIGPCAKNKQDVRWPV